MVYRTFKLYYSCSKMVHISVKAAILWTAQWAANFYHTITCVNILQHALPFSYCIMFAISTVCWRLWPGQWQYELLARTTWTVGSKQAYAAKPHSVMYNKKTTPPIPLNINAQHTISVTCAHNVLLFLQRLRW